MTELITSELLKSTKLVDLLQFIEANKYQHLDFTRPNAHRTAVDYEDLKKEIEKLQRME